MKLLSASVIVESIVRSVIDLVPITNQHGQQVTQIVPIAGHSLPLD
jgi:hypothetical protein